MINGAHVILFSQEADALRDWFRDVLELPSVDAGEGWLIFGLPPAEVAVHPAEGTAYHELYLMCDDIEATMTKLRGKGVQFDGEVRDQGWGRLVSIVMPDGGRLGLYQPRHPSPPRSAQQA